MSDDESNPDPATLDERPEYENAVLERAVEIVNAKIPELPEHDTLESLTDEQVLIVAFSIIARDYAIMIRQRREPPQTNKCGWCVDAAGRTGESWRSAQSMTWEEIKEHTLVCDHNPLVQQLEHIRNIRDGITFSGADHRRKLDVIFEIVSGNTP